MVFAGGNDYMIDLVNNFFVFFGPLTVFGKCGFFKTNHRAAHASALCRACSMVSKEIRFPPRSTFSTPKNVVGIT
jgi:hypothetical protein